MTEDQRFIQQYQTSEKYILPYTGVANTVLEIGCGEGGNLLPYFNKRCKVTGIDISASKIRYAKSQFNGEFIYTDVYSVMLKWYEDRKSVV